MNYKPSVFNFEIPFDDRYILYNTYSGALSLIDRPLADSNVEEIRKELVRQGFIVDERLNETNRFLIERNREMYTSRIRYLHIEIAPTMTCQAHCWYCFENTSKEKHTMSPTIVQDVIKYIIERIEFSQCERLTLLFFGGEPLLAVEQMVTIGSEIKRICQSKNIMFHSEIISNGLLFTEKTANMIISAINLTNIQITLDGIRETHNHSKGISCFDTVIDNIVRNVEKTKISIRLNVSSKNCGEIEPLVDYLLCEKGLDGKIRIYLARVDDLDSCGLSGEVCLDNFSFVDFREQFMHRAMKKYKSFDPNDLLPDIKRNYCGYEKISQILIGPEGELYRCQRTLSDKENAIGDIYNGSFYRDEELSLLRSLPEECIAPCNLLPTCFGGCPNERRKGKPLLYCELKKKQIEKGIKNYVETMIFD